METRRTQVGIVVEDEMAYKYNIIFYSAQQSRRNPTPDTILAAAFADKLEEKMKNYGYRGYNADKHATLGASVYKEHFRIVDETDWTIVIVTPDFFRDYWADYKNESAFNFLKRKGQRHKLIPIAVETNELQELDVNNPLFFPDRKSWEDEDKWRRIKQRFEGRQHPEEPVPGQPFQAFGDNRLRTDQQNIVTRPVSAASSMASFVGSIDASVEGQGIPVAYDDYNSGIVLPATHNIPEPPIASMSSLNLAGDILRDGATSADVSVDGCLSGGTAQNGSMVSHNNDDADIVDDLHLHNELQEDDMTNRILDSAPSLSLRSMPDYNLSETLPPIDHQPENARASNIAHGLSVERETATKDTDQLKDDDLDIDAQQSLTDPQSPTLPACAQREEDMSNLRSSKSNTTTDNIQNQENVRSIPGLSDNNSMSPAAENWSQYCDTKPEGASGFSPMNILRMGVNTLLNLGKWLTDGDRAFN